MGEGVLSGERVVIFLAILRVLSSVQSSLLLLESVALFFLAIAALAVEILVDGSELTLFQTRRGASSGILLGTISIPLVLFSKLIRLSQHDVESIGLGDIGIQYWSASVGSLAVLIFLPLALCTQKQRRQPFLLRKLCFASYAAFCFLSLAACCQRAWYCTSWKAFWVCFHGLAAVGFMQHILLTFPFCASIGEALIAANGLVLYLFDAFLYTITKVDTLSCTKVLQHGPRSKISTFVQGVLVGILLLATSYKYFSQTWGSFTNAGSEIEKNGVSGRVHRSVAFHVLLGFVLTVCAPAWMYFVHDFEVYPILWAFNFVFTMSMNRVFLCLYWLGIICLSIVRFYKISKHSLIERILLRKYYHLVAVLMFVPAVVLEPEFLDLAFGAALGVFSVVEIIRVWRIWPFGELIHNFMNAFTDHRDSDLLIVSHFSLLLGCALPKWLSSGLNDRPLAPFAGILSLGIGDTMASMVGHKYGVLRWSKTGKKTIEGTVAGITSVLLACSMLLPVLASKGYFLSQEWLPLVIAVSLSGLLEAYTAQLDNAFIPLFFYSLLSV